MGKPPPLRGPGHRRYNLPWRWPVLAAFLGLFLLAWALLWFEAVGQAFLRAGIHPRLALMMLLASLVGAGMNVPLLALRGEPEDLPHEVPRTVRVFGVPYVTELLEEGRTVVAVNLGGAVVPLILSVRLAANAGVPGRMAAATAAVAVVSFLLARPVPGVGIALPFLVPPVVAAVSGLLLGGRDLAPAIAYVAGSVGTLVGADLLHLKDIRRLRSTMVSIGGAGTFEGIFLNGVLAALIA